MGIKSKIKFNVNLKNKKQLVIGILGLIAIILIGINLNYYLRAKRELKQIQFIESEVFQNQISADFEKVMVPMIIYEVASKDKEGYIKKIDQERDQIIAKVENDKILNLGAIRIEKAKKLREICENYGFELPDDYQINGFYPKSFDDFDKQVSKTRVQ